jgi:hypothetical protein
MDSNRAQLVQELKVVCPDAYHQTPAMDSDPLADASEPGKH